MGIRDVIRTATEVELPDGQKVMLTVPSMADAVKVRALVTGADLDNPDPALLLRLTIAALQGCLPAEALTDEEAYQVIAATGGEGGALAEAARTLAGISVGDDGGEGADDVPT